jgi:hypothetical protein
MILILFFLFYYILKIILNMDQYKSSIEVDEDAGSNSKNI